ncbi:MAG: outer membrane lipoprotein carrier protein LolA [Comamonadaceae bacterium]|nr:MAG: outer membrane lipoprotein carrier protein LolA [Comamonadaceae bacterium]
MWGAFPTLAATDPQDSEESRLATALRARLGQPDWLQGEFEQSKQVQGFKKPLLSRGDFVIARGRGVLWRTRTPFASELKLTRNQMEASQGGAPALRMDSQREPALRLVNEMMFALLGGDIAALSQLFVLEGELLGERAWRITLVPKQAAWRQVLQSIDLAGERHVREVRIVEAAGDQTKIRFSALKESAPVPATVFD